MDNLKANRELYNNKILDLLSGFLKENPDIRFNQLMFILNGTSDHFNEEPEITFNRFSKKLIINK